MWCVASNPTGEEVGVSPTKPRALEINWGNFPSRQAGRWDFPVYFVQMLFPDAVIICWDLGSTVTAH